MGEVFADFALGEWVIGSRPATMWIVWAVTMRFYPRFRPDRDGLATPGLTDRGLFGGLAEGHERSAAGVAVWIGDVFCIQLKSGGAAGDLVRGYGTYDPWLCHVSNRPRRLPTRYREQKTVH